MTTTILLLIAGLVLLVLGAEALVRGASRLAAAVGVSPLVIGLTVVAFGTSAPELAVSIKSALAGQSDITIGNVVGSNIFNVLFILGVAALVRPLVVHQQLVRLDVPLLIGVAGLTWLLAGDGLIGIVDGLVLVTGMAAYTVFAVYLGRRESRAVQAEYQEALGPVPQRTTAAGLALQVLLIVVGLVLLVLGARWLVDGAVALARSLGISELLIGLTIIAAGTSLPEVATSVMASIRGQQDIAVGNAIGSCIANLLLILGVAALIVPPGVPVPAAVRTVDLPVMLAAAVICFPVIFTGRRIVRWEGALFLGGYLAYTIYLVLSAS